MRAKLQLNVLVPTLPVVDLATWWLDSLQGTTSSTRKVVNSLIMLTWWMLWKERNARIFDRKASTVEQVTDKIMDEIFSWRMAGLGGVSALARPPD